MTVERTVLIIPADVGNRVMEELLHLLEEARVRTTHTREVRFGLERAKCFCQGRFGEAGDKELEEKLANNVFEVLILIGENAIAVAKEIRDAKIPEIIHTSEDEDSFFYELSVTTRTFH